MDVEEKKRLRKLLLDCDKLFKNFLKPLPLLEKMPYFPKESEAHIKIHKEAEFPVRQVQIFLEELENSTERGTLQSFLDALRATPDQEWLYQLVTGEVPDKDIQKYFYHVENIDQINQVLAIIKPQLKGIKFADELLDDMVVFLPPSEITDPTWLKHLYKHVRERRYNDGDSARTTLADALQQYFDFGSESDDVSVIQVHLFAEKFSKNIKLNNNIAKKEDMDVDEKNTETATVSCTYTENKTKFSNADAPMELNIPPPTLPPQKPPPPSNIKKFDESKKVNSLFQSKPLSTDDRFRVGERVRITLDEDNLKLLQTDHGGWSSAMPQLIGKPGFVHRISDNGDVLVRYEKRMLRDLQCKKPIWTIHPAALERMD